MTPQYDSIGQLRSAFTMREFEKAKHSLQGGTIGTFMRAILAITFMYLIFVSYLMLGITGPVFVSILFLAALFFPYLYQALKNRLEKRKTEKERLVSVRESTQES